MYYAKYVKGVSRVNAARLALWAALLFIVLVAGMAVLGPRLRAIPAFPKPVGFCPDAG